MTWLFIRFYVGILAVLLSAWLIYDRVLESRRVADIQRVVIQAHRGGMRLIVQQLSKVEPDARESELQSLSNQFRTDLALVQLQELPDNVRANIESGEDCVCMNTGRSQFLVGSDSGKKPYVQMGPFPNYTISEIESLMVGWARIARDELKNAIGESDSGAMPSVESLAALRKKFDIGVDVVQTNSLPSPAQQRIVVRDAADLNEVVFYEAEPEESGQWYAAIEMERDVNSLRFGPFPSFEEIDQTAATTTLALVLVPVALSIAFLLRPVARQLREVEDAAKAFAAGDMDARVDHPTTRAADSLAQSFNAMADQTQSLLNSQRELLQAVSHELRTPLARIRFAADLVESAEDDVQRKERLQAVDDATQQLDDLVGELLSYVRGESGNPRNNADSVCVRDILCETRDAIAPLHPSIKMVVSEHSEDVLLATDRAQLVRAISNILRNAARYAKSTVELSTFRRGGSVCILIDDDGDGIPPADQEKVFQPFVRLGKGGDSGTGLGLALVLRIVTAHGGKVNIDTSPLGGARFIISMPSDVSR